MSVFKKRREDSTIFFFNWSLCQEVLIQSNLNHIFHNSSLLSTLLLWNYKMLLFIIFHIFETYSKPFSASPNFQKHVLLRISVNFILLVEAGV